MAARDTYRDEDCMLELSESLGVLPIHDRQVFLRPNCDLEEVDNALEVEPARGGKAYSFVSFLKTFDFVPVLSRHNFSTAGTTVVNVDEKRFCLD